MTENQCARCGSEFSCGMASDKPCWCATDFPNVLSGNIGNTCLCPECLTDAIASKTDLLE
ncbi:MAG: cysteine-rich CWC family protein, partial [Burkholderiales bacterium]|nr:cysteine-rich CWC family protein [Burkholderiales bacterium]